MGNSRKDKLQGIAISLPTFNDDDFNLELDKSRLHIQWLMDQGLEEGNCVFFIAGGLGEGYFLDDYEWEAMANTLAESTKGKVPTGIGVFELSARRAARKAKYAADLGIDFIQCAAPHYMQPTEDEIFLHFQYISDRADVGIMPYNIPWAMPGGYEYSRRLIERFTTIDNVVGLKWKSSSWQHYLDMIRLFGNELNFISNGNIMSLGYKYGAKGFTDFTVNVAPRLSLHRLQLIREKRFEEYDEQEIATRMDPSLHNVGPGEMSPTGMGEGPSARLTLSTLGLHTGPHFPAQAPFPQSHIDAHIRSVDASGIRDWIDWNQSIFTGVDRRKA